MMSGADSITLKLGKSITLAQIQELYCASSSLVEDDIPAKICIDAVENEVIEFPAIQVLVAVVELAKSKGVEIIWENPSIALFEKSMELGMDHKLGL
ncbi:MAG: hypothetical protein GKR91_19470 [Pseudomonadales bacterium]|nr:hypothetical protein [Pseudomonadales bacterium]